MSQNSKSENNLLPKFPSDFGKKTYGKNNAKRKSAYLLKTKQNAKCRKFLTKRYWS